MWSRSRYVFATALGINAVGNGLYLTVATIYFTLHAGLDPAALGVFLGVAAAVGIVAGPVLGHWADRFGARHAYCLLLGVSCLASLLLSTVRSPYAIAGCLALFAGSESGAAAARGALIAALVPREHRVRYRAVLRSVANVGMAAGAGLAGLVLLTDSATWFRVAIIANAATFALAAGLTLTIPEQSLRPAWSPEATSGGADRPRTSLRLALLDRRFLVVVALNSVLCLHVSVLMVGAPLWIVHRTEAPTWVMSMLLLINTVGVAGLVPLVARRVDSRQAVRPAAAVTGSSLAVMCLFFALTGWTSGVLTIVLLALAGLGHLLGELIQAALGWYLAFELALEQAHGQYQGVFNSGRDVVDAIAPPLFAAVVLLPGSVGWAVLAALFVAAGLLLPRAASRAFADRPAIQARLLASRS